MTHWGKLADFLLLDEQQRRCILQKPAFPLNLPLRLAQKIQKGTLEDPILKQFLPVAAEKEEVPGFVGDPVGDRLSQRSLRLLQKYRGRALLVCSGACVMNCRFCFRQNYAYDDEDKSFDREVELISRDPTIHEIILSGGDPLSLGERALGSLLNRLSAIPHVLRLRFHTRFPIGIPERIDEEFLSMLSRIPQQVFFVIHCNHPRELDADIFARLRSLKALGVVLLAHTVLLRGINDNLETLEELFQNLANQGILPYYLNQLDRVRGAAHFEVPEATGSLLLAQLRARLPGYAVPKYAKEVAGEPNKVPIS